MSRVYSADVPCPQCGLRQSRVLNSEGTKLGSVRRRRVCVCGKRYNTYEHLGRDPKTVASRIRLIAALLHDLMDDLNTPSAGM